MTIWKCGKGADLDTTILQGLIKSIANPKNSGEPEEEPDNSAGKICNFQYVFNMFNLYLMHCHNIIMMLVKFLEMLSQINN